MGNPLTRLFDFDQKLGGGGGGVAPATQANSMDNRKTFYREVKRIRSAWTRSVVSSRVIDMLIASPRNP